MEFVLVNLREKLSEAVAMQSNRYVLRPEELIAILDTILELQSEVDKLSRHAVVKDSYYE